MMHEDDIDYLCRALEIERDLFENTPDEGDRLHLITIGVAKLVGKCEGYKSVYESLDRRVWEKFKTRHPPRLDEF